MQQANSLNMITRINMNHNRNTALERSIINYGGSGVWGVNRFYVRTTLALGSAVVHKHISYSVRVKDF